MLWSDDLISLISMAILKPWLTEIRPAPLLSCGVNSRGLKGKPFFSFFFFFIRTTWAHIQSRSGCTPSIAHAQGEPFPGHKSRLCFKTYWGLSETSYKPRTLGVQRVHCIFCGYHSSASSLMRLWALPWFQILSEKYILLSERYFVSNFLWVPAVFGF